MAWDVFLDETHTGTAGAQKGDKIPLATNLEITGLMLQETDMHSKDTHTGKYHVKNTQKHCHIPMSLS